MYNGFYLQYPYILSLLILFLFCTYFCKMRLASIYFPHTYQFMQSSVARSKILSFLRWITIVMMLLALSSPVKDEPYELEPKDGYEIALVLDASQSMQAQGFHETNKNLNRFDVVKTIVNEFIKQRRGDNIGLVVFGQYSFIASPLTYDERILTRIVSQLQIGMAGKYTALYEALAQGVNLLKMSESKSKVVILLTDGHSTPGVDKIPLDVTLDMVKKEKIKVYPIGIGLPNEYNRKVLMKIAKESGGVAFGASSASQLADVYARIDALETSEIKAQSYVDLNYYYHYPLFIAFFSLIFYTYLRNKRGHE